MNTGNLVGRAVPYYDGDRLLIRGTFASDDKAQAVRAKVRDGIIDSMSVGFRAFRWEVIDGVRTCTSGELLEVSFVRVASNPGARVLSVRSYTPPTTVGGLVADSLLLLARLEVADAKAFLAGLPPGPHRGPVRRSVDRSVRNALRPAHGTASAAVDDFLRRLL